MALDASRVQAILFDVDGTLADTDDEYIRRVAQLIRPIHFMFPQRDPTRFLRWGLMTAESPLNTLVGIPDWLTVDDELVALFNWLADRRGNAVSSHFVAMPGVEALLNRLAPHYALAVITARSARGTHAFLQQFEFGKLFRAAVSAQTAPHTKPYPDPVWWAARALAVPVENCLVVGDTTVDILAGKRARAQTAGVLCGFGERAELERAGADLILADTAELADVLLPARPHPAQPDG